MNQVGTDSRSVPIGPPERGKTLRGFLCSGARGHVVAKKKAAEQVVWEEWDSSWLKMLEIPVADDSPQVVENIMNVLRNCRRMTGEPLSDCAVCRRVKGSTPSQVARIRAEMRAAGERLAGETMMASKDGE